MRNQKYYLLYKLICILPVSLSFLVIWETKQTWLCPWQGKGDSPSHTHLGKNEKQHKWWFPEATNKVPTIPIPRPVRWANF